MGFSYTFVNYTKGDRRRMRHMRKLVIDGERWRWNIITDAVILQGPSGARWSCNPDVAKNPDGSITPGRVTELIRRIKAGSDEW